MASTCRECGRSLALVSCDEVARTRVSHGFGAANDELVEFCSIACKARWLDVDAVLEATRQATLAAFNETASAAERIAWSVR